jgi:hypothetical protein
LQIHKENKRKVYWQEKKKTEGKVVHTKKAQAKSEEKITIT